MKQPRTRRLIDIRTILENVSFFLEDLNPIYPIVIITLIVTVCFLLNSIATELPKLNSRKDWNTKTDSTFHNGCIDTQQYLLDPEYIKQNATFVMLARNKELQDVISTLESIESHFNQWFHYPYTFLNDEPFTEEFMNEIRNLVSSNVSFGQLSPEAWHLTDSYSLKQNLDLQGDRDILYGDIPSYHKMCRFYSGFFFRHELVSQYEWYWRIEPEVEFHCDLTYDPFLEMNRSGKKYGFTVIIPELPNTIPTLFRKTLSFIKQNNITVGSLWKLFTMDHYLVDTTTGVGGGREQNNTFEIIDKWINYPGEITEVIQREVEIEHLMSNLGSSISKSGLKNLIDRAKGQIPLVTNQYDQLEYNLCHFWSNFEIARVDIFNNDLYLKYFEYLDQQNGFWEERWGDAPVHSLGLSLALNVSDIHYFRDIGYRHSSLQHCPKNYISEKSSIFNLFSLAAMTSGSEPQYIATDERWQRSRKQKKYDKGYITGTGCRCRCPNDYRELEDSPAYCQNMWLDLTKEENPDKPREPLVAYTVAKSIIKENFIRTMSNN
ncbi:alpha-1,2-mannosyltransferase (Kre5) [Maudiozyma exigua]|uniref:Alpha-1,2-mannosyltransferase (Kre5) n=1 Tax=Maudiozyma exigua TaxID=34358 RepID=A0A9P6WB42_MAUEX|nr:alpha-1,2-mannosyltransferase (Kre5) [Kazachstania exigua]